MVKGIIGKVTLKFHWYCKTTYNLEQFFFPKRLIIWNNFFSQSDL